MTKFLLTMQFNEVLLLPVFLAHYSKYFGPREIFVIDHGSNEQPSFGTDPPYNTIRVPRHRPFSEVARMRLISHLSAGLLQYFDVGVYADCDELIDLEPFDEGELTRSPVIYVAGFDVFHHQTPTGNRLYGLFNPRECKPLIFRTVPNWGPGFHGCDHPPTGLKLPLAHTRYLYKEESARRLRQRAAVYEEMNVDEKSRGIDSHWANGDTKYRNFERKVDEYLAAGMAPDKFEPVDPSPYFTSAAQYSFGAASRRSYEPKTPANSPARPVIDLTDHFGNLI